MRGKHLRRRFSLQPSFMKDDTPEEDKHKRDKVGRNNAVDDAVAPANTRHKIVVMGAAKVGKTSIITQFLYNTFNAKYKKTVEEMYQGNFSISGVSLTLDILDTSGSFEFPAMRTLSISSAEAFILVYDVTDEDSWREVQMIRDLIYETKAIQTVPIVIVGNKKDLAEDGIKPRVIEYTTAESTVTIDWENGFVETSAAKNENVTQVFKELLTQAKITYNLSPALRRRRQSLPQQVGGSAHNTPGHHHRNQQQQQQQQQQSGASSSSAEHAHPSHAPTAAQLQHLQRIQERSLGGKRNSCTIS